MSSESKALGDPSSMRRANRRTGFGYADPIGEYELANGLTVYVLWVPTDRHHHHVIVWDGPGGSILRTVEHVVTANAGRVSEQILRQLES